MIRRDLLLAVPLAAALGAALATSGWMLAVRTDSAAPAVPAAPDQRAAPRVEQLGGETVVTLPPDMLRGAALALTPLAPPARGQQAAYAVTLDLQPLFDAAQRLAAARGERDAARAQADAAAAQAQRLQSLYQDRQNVSLKAAEDAAAAASAAQARRIALDRAQADAGAGLRQQFGAALADAAAHPASPLWRKLLRGAAGVLRATLPADARAPAVLLVQAPGGRQLRAGHLGAAPQLDPLVQGQVQLYLVEPALPQGLRTAAYAPAPDLPSGAVLVPDSAVLWHEDAPWAYVRIAPGRFARRLIEGAQARTGGLLATGGLRAGDQVVTRGAALLLSEELRPLPLATMCKDPPECDD
jgi:hypothetical protein